MAVVIDVLMFFLSLFGALLALFYFLVIIFFDEIVHIRVIGRRRHHHLLFMRKDKIVNVLRALSSACEIVQFSETVNTSNI